MTELLYGLIGTGFGILLKTIYDHYKFNKDRKDKYFFALLNKRFEAYQEAYSLCQELKKVVHDQSGEKIETVHKARDWYNKNCLYLKPDIRKNFNQLIYDVSFYGNELEDFKFTLREKGQKHEETVQKRTKLLERWGNIMSETQEALKNDLNQYYNELEK